MTITLTDFFCGAGGSSAGAALVNGVELKAALNHWDRAIETHAENHPAARHILADISQFEPSLTPRTTIAWLSPSCTKHSIAQGKKLADAQPDLFGEVLPDAAAERSRATMWDVVRFSEYHHYEAVIVENVVEVTNWPPYRAWLVAMDSLGYDHEVVMLNSMHAQLMGPGAPQSRDRFYAVFWRRGNRKPDLHRLTRPNAICPECGPVRAMQSWKRPDREPIGKYRSQYVYRCPNVACRNQVVEPIVRPDEPVRTVTTHGHQSLLAADRPTIDLDEVRFRMLEPSEIKRAMDFPADYVGKGTRREQVRLWGNAVTPPAARDLVHLVAESLGRK